MRMAAARKRLIRLELLVALGLGMGLCACGGGETGQTDDPSVFNKESAWSGTFPVQAEIMDSAEFTRLVKAGELQLVRPGDNDARRVARQAEVAQDQAYLAGLTERTPAAQAALAAFQTSTAPNAEPVVTVGGGGQVRLLSDATLLQGAAQYERDLRDPASRLAVYHLAYDLLPAAAQAQLPSPTTLQGATLVQLQAATKALNVQAALVPALMQSGRPDAAQRSSLSGQALLPGNGMDNDGPCTPDQLAGQLCWPLKDFLSPMKNQAKRGTCWAFTTLGALESRERVQFGRTVDLSEQFLVNKVKRDWQGEDYGDGYWPADALAFAVQKGQNFPLESTWTYNPASMRANGAGDSEGDYSGTCQAYTGTCSNTAHESRKVCSTGFLGLTSCAYATVSYSGNAAAPVMARAVHPNVVSQATLRALLSGGYTLMGSFHVTPGFKSPNQGYVTEEGGPDDRGHAVQIVGFIDNATLGRAVVEGGLILPAGFPASGGYFIVKNSWGCGWGDAGYAYVTPQYVEEHFALWVLDFPGDQRSDAWKAGSLNPAPIIRVLPETSLSVPLRVPSPVADLRLPPSTDGNLDDVQVTLISSVSGDRLRKGSTFQGATTLEGIFVTPGPRTVTLIASLNGRSSQQSFTVKAINALPSVSVLAPAEIHLGETYTLRATITDRNEPDLSALCSRTLWTLSPGSPGTLSGTTGCTTQFKATGTGAVSVIVSTTDSDGGGGQGSATFDVLPALVNPYPRLNGGAVRPAESLVAGRCATGKFTPEGATINLTVSSTGCAGQANESPYTASIGVENPSGETLSYTWFFWVGTPSSTVSSFDTTANYTPYFVYTFTPEAVPCGVSVRVNAPDPLRSKVQPIWSGICIGKTKPIG